MIKPVNLSLHSEKTKSFPVKKITSQKTGSPMSPSFGYIFNKNSYFLHNVSSPLKFIGAKFIDFCNLIFHNIN